MAEIRAFVGHSFSPDDDGVVNAFLKYFDQLQGLLPAFDWTHALAAEPKDLAEKVRALIADRNVFIGICSRRERAIMPSKLRVPLTSFGNGLGARAEDYEWKTSDWVIQEIELAIGRGMSLVLLLENGCRRPGGLQGDIEFISFDRAAPEKAFGKILEMLKALSPPARPAASPITEGPGAADEVPEPPEENEVPDGTWDKKRYGRAFLWKLFDDEKAAAEIEAAYLATDDGKDETKRAEWIATTEMWRIITDHGGSLDRVKELAAKYPANVEVLSNLAAALSKFGNHLDAAAKYQAAADAEPTPPEVQRIRGLAAIELVRADRADLAARILDAQREWIRSNPDGEMQLLTTMREIAGATKNDDLAVEVMERIVEIKPDDYDVRFSLAYKHSERGNEDLALHHYLQIPPARRAPVTWNNLGVSFQHFAMPAKAVDAYERAAVSEETLAMSNLGYKLMQSGFVREAEIQFTNAMKIDNFHRNVGEGIAALRDLPEQEDETQQDTLEKAKLKIDFLRRLGRAITQRTVAQLTPQWRGPECELALAIDGDLFTAVGSYDRPGNAFALGSMKPTRHRLEYRGSVVGARIDGFVQRISEGEPPPSLLSLGLQDNKTAFSMIIDDAAGKIAVAENPSSPSPRFYELDRT